jgi:hypothetical protein
MRCLKVGAAIALLIATSCGENGSKEAVRPKRESGDGAAALGGSSMSGAPGAGGGGAERGPDGSETTSSSRGKATDEPVNSECYLGGRCEKKSDSSPSKTSQTEEVKGKIPSQCYLGGC